MVSGNGCSEKGPEKTAPGPLYLQIQPSSFSILIFLGSAVLPAPVLVPTM